MRAILSTLLFFATATAALSAQAPAAGSNPPPPAGNAENGKKIYASYGCYQCHGYEAQGGPGVRLAARPIAFAAFSKYVRQPTGDMPPYTRKVVSDKEAADIYAFLQAIPQPPPAGSIPLLNR
jgi:mono/diheme cytochrome c family protein